MSPAMIAVTILFVAALGLMAAKIIYDYKKHGTKFDIDTFMEVYSPRIIECIKDAVEILQVSTSSYATKEEYELAIINLTIVKFKESCKEFSIDTTVFDMLDADKISELIYDILHKNEIDIFSILSKEEVEEHVDLYDADVIADHNIELSNPVIQLHIEDPVEEENDEKLIQSIEEEEATKTDIADIGETIAADAVAEESHEEPHEETAPTEETPAE